MLASLLANARSHIAAGRPAAGAALLDRVRELLQTAPAADPHRFETAALLLDLGDPLAAVRLVDGDAPSSQDARRIQRRACYEAAALIRAGKAGADLGSAFGQRMARLPSVRPEEILTAYRQISAIFDPIEATAGPYPAADYAKAYTICMTPRSGSTFLIDVMTEAGVFGRPHEYLQRYEPSALPTLAPRFRTPTLTAFVDALAANTRTPNCVYGLKADVDMLLPLLIDGTFARTLHAGKFIYVTRGDVVMQAISLTRAQITGAWKAGTSAPAFHAPVYDFAHIHKNVIHLTEMMARWESFFAFHGIAPLRIGYEDIDADVADAIGRIAAHLDLPAPSLPPRAPRHVQRDAASEDWRARFLTTLNGPGS